ncbi:MAG TPA: site-specific integrase, partial [Archangium sp.]
MGSVYPKGKRLYFKVKVDGVWRNIRTEYLVGQERQARAMLDRLEERRAAGVETVGDLGPVTVSRFFDSWIKERERHVRTWKNDESVMRIHVLPSIGSMRLDEVRAKHIVDLVKGWRSKPADERLAPKSIYNAYSTVSALFRDADLADLIDSDPCKLTKHQLGPKVDADPEWRPTALFTVAELELLIGDDRLPMDSRVLYALEGIAALRHGEAAGLLWRNVQPELEPLGMIYVANNYEHPLPKGDVCRPVPMHPTLAAIIAEWKLHGWARMMGRPPTPDDLVLPLPPEAKSKFGRWRRKGFSYDRLERDLEVLGLRHRRGHDLRRTMISLCRSNGANRDILRRATHKPPKEVIEGYTSFEWAVVCAEV